MLIVPTARQTASARRRQAEEGEQAGEQVHPGRHHGGRVQQRAHRGRALHRVRQPGEQRELRALADDAAEDQERGERHQCRARRRAGGRAVQLQDARGCPSWVRTSRTPRKKATSPKPGHHEGLLAGLAGAELLVPEPDQQVGGESDQLPEDVELEQGRGERQVHHGPGEERHEGVVAREPRVPGHVAERVHLDQKADGGDDQEHEQAERVEQEADADGRSRRRRARSSCTRAACRGLPVAGEQGHGADERDRHRGERQGRGQPRPAARPEHDRDEGRKRQPGGQRGERSTSSPGVRRQA